MPLDPDDSRPAYLQVADHLRRDILARRFAPGEQLPSRAELVTRFAVAPMTVQNALRELRDEGLIVSRQGAGVFVRVRMRQDADARARTALRLLGAIHRSTGGDDPRCAECVDVAGKPQRWPCRTWEQVAPVLEGDEDGS